MNSRRHTITSLSIVLLAVTIMSVSVLGQSAYAAGGGMSLSADCSGSSCDISGTTDRNNEPVMLVVSNDLGIHTIGQMDVSGGSYSDSINVSNYDDGSYSVDVNQGESPYELVLWIPLVNCAKTKSMYILPKKIHDKNLKNFKKYHSTDEIFKKLNKKLKWLKINYGQGLIFTQNILHGNVVNKENTSRWSFNCRFKSLLSPYEGKTIGDFFIKVKVLS